MNISSLMEDVIEEGLNDLSTMTIETDEYERSLNNFVKIADVYVDIKKVELEATDKKETQKNDKQYRWAQIGVSILGVAIPAAVAIWAYKSSNDIEFKQNDVQTSRSGKEAFKKLVSLKW